jgi:demethoxyubiquinone hydroxylase (CLK1/Coq7/Cat5 family)
MQRQSLLVVLWMISSFAVGAIVFSPLDGAAFSLVTTFALGAIFRIRDIYE